MIQRELLLARAVNRLEAVQLEMAAGNYQTAAERLEDAIDMVKEAIR